MNSSLPTTEKAPGDLVDPVSRELVRIDWRLLDERLWLKQPELIYSLLTDLAADGGGKGLEDLARSYLAVIKNRFQPEAYLPKDVDYFLVLGNVLNADTTPTPELTARLESALWASGKNPAAQLLVSGGAQVRGIKESEVMKRWLIDRGVCPSRILQESESLDTVENIRMSTRLLMQKNARNVCLISGAQGASRGLCLLLSHLQHIGSAIKAVYVADLTSAANRFCVDIPAAEKFLLFKDLGRIFGLWTYRER